MKVMKSKTESEFFTNLESLSFDLQEIISVDNGLLMSIIENGAAGVEWNEEILIEDLPEELAEKCNNLNGEAYSVYPDRCARESVFEKLIYKLNQ